MYREQRRKERSKEEMEMVCWEKVKKRRPVDEKKGLKLACLHDG